MKQVLFVCGKNRLRSPTAEQVFADHPGISTSSAGLNRDADVLISAEMIREADLILAMERSHRSKLQRQFRSALNGKRIVVLNIPDVYEYMDEDLVALLRVRVTGFLLAA